MKKGHGKVLVLTLVNTVVLSVVYFILAKMEFPLTHYIYVGVGACLAIWYVVYNRGFSGWGITMDMLPPEMPPDEKIAFLNDSKHRKQNSKWILTVLFPILIVIVLDLVYLFCFPELKEWAKKII